LLKVLVGPIQFAAYAAISYDSISHSPSQVCVFVVMKLLDSKRHEEMVKSIYNAALEVPYGGYVLLYQYVHRAPWSRSKVIIYFFTLPWFLLGLLVDIFAMPLMILNIIINELVIMTAPLPTNEANFAIGQWGPWVSSALVIFAAVINKSLEFWEKAKQAKRENREEVNKASEAGSSYTFELGTVEAQEGQTMGVVKPKLGHVQTLQDISLHIEGSRR
jgi:hypothetical protein